MGLDVYLHHWLIDYAEAKHVEAQGREREEEITQRFVKQHRKSSARDLNELEWQALREQLTAAFDALGLDRYGEYSAAYERIELPSEKYPEHMFKLGYWRSSYNDGGINGVLRRTIGKSLYDLLPGNPDTGEDIFPDWNDMLALALALRAGFQTYQELGKYDVRTVEAHSISQDASPVTPREALEIFFNERERHDRAFENYENMRGTFLFHSPMIVRGIIPGKQRNGPWQIDVPAVESVMYIIHEQDHSWYAQALDIVVETIEYVLKQEDKERYGMYWSG